jgi:PhzF family phenazine biosynthesis protein
MSAVSILQVDAFTDRPFAGNPAGVVLDADGLAEPTMQGIAAEMNLAETAFVSRPGGASGRPRLRWFTPTREVRYCGHATVATVHAMVEAGRLSGPRVVFDTLGGALPVEVEHGGAGVVVWLDPAVPELRPAPPEAGAITADLGLSDAGQGTWAAAAVTSDGDLLVPAAGLDVVRALAPEMGALGRRADAAGLRGVCVVSRETVEVGSATHCRFFAPHFGIPEDPVTGSVHSSIAVWLCERGLLSVVGGHASFVGEQGDAMGRPGRLVVRVHARDGRATRVRVGGRAVTVMEGRLRLPA